MYINQSMELPLLIAIRYLEKQASWRPAQGSKKAKCLKYSRETTVESFICHTLLKNAERHI